MPGARGAAANRAAVQHKDLQPCLGAVGSRRPRRQCRLHDDDIKTRVQLYAFGGARTFLSAARCFAEPSTESECSMCSGEAAGKNVRAPH